MQVIDAEQATAVITHHGEGPVWHGEPGELTLVDMLAGDIVSVDASGELKGRQRIGTVAAAVRPRRDGGYVVARERGFGLVSADGELTTLPDLWNDPGVRMNEGACDTEGRFYAGSMAFDMSVGRGALYRLDLDGSVSVVLDGLTVSNGLAFTPDGRSAVFVDSASQQLRRYRIPADGRQWTDAAVIADIDPAIGTPDGICTDQTGGVWVALWAGGTVHRYDFSGTLTAIVRVPVPNVTACALGGADGRTLWITTSRLGANPLPSAGAVFRARVKVPGEPVLLAGH